MVIYYDPKEANNCRREVLVPVDRDAPGLKTKKIKPIRAGFIVYSGISHPPEYYYEELLKHLKERNLKPITGNFCSMEAVYQPDNFNLSSGSFVDEDSQDTWTVESDWEQKQTQMWIDRCQKHWSKGASPCYCAPYIAHAPAGVVNTCAK